MNNLEQDAEQAIGGGGGNMGGGNQQQGGSSGGSGIDKEVNSVVDKFASEEGVPGMADGMINKDVDAEVNKFT
ncbi:hypothetical protein JMJ35_009347 [Cladonia borealis]|uniref:Uncharacterized protein n=1 Tax=Cladonia borealis TaxID=184061 RepID=A0AA39QSC4_9LECA|nr:hypothetical protein JMJ35_009347 [Cladonia borealis]